jgi:uncharacterized damage-inducible protein DinB
VPHELQEGSRDPLALPVRQERQLRGVGVLAHEPVARGRVHRPDVHAAGSPREGRRGRVRGRDLPCLTPHRPRWTPLPLATILLGVTNPAAPDVSELLGPLSGRVDPPWATDERSMLEAWLEYHRATLAIKCSGLSAAQLCQASTPPSPLSLLGLVRHMTEVERFWFQRCLQGADEPPLYYTDDNPDGDMLDVVPHDAAEDVHRYADQCATSRTSAAGVPDLDHLAPWSFGDEHASLRWIYVHMIEEYARHNGHADLIREAIDGATGE